MDDAKKQENRQCLQLLCNSCAIALVFIVFGSLILAIFIAYNLDIIKTFVKNGI